MNVLYAEHNRARDDQSTYTYTRVGTYIEYRALFHLLSSPTYPPTYSPTYINLRQTCL